MGKHVDFELLHCLLACQLRTTGNKSWMIERIRMKYLEQLLEGFHDETLSNIPTACISLSFRVL